MKRALCIVGVVLALPLVVTPRAHADTCDDRCHVDTTGGGGGCGQVGRDTKDEDRCFAECRAARSSGPPATPIPPSGECAATTTLEACSTCCSDHHGAAVQQYQADMVACLCQADACQSPCATTACAAAPTDATDECYACATTSPEGRSCRRETSERCDGVPDCHAFKLCLQDGCRGKN